MTNQERLIKVMEYKQSCLPEEFQKIFFNEEDAKALRSLTDGKAEEAISVMIDNINNKYYKDSALCPFCVLFYDDPNFCEGCNIKNSMAIVLKMILVIPLLQHTPKVILSENT